MLRKDYTIECLEKIIQSESFLFLVFLTPSSLFPSQVLVLNVLYRVIEPDKFLFLAPFILHLPPLLLLPLQLSLLLLLIPLLEYLKLLICPLDQFVQFIYFLIKFILAFLCFCCQFLWSLLYVHIFSVQILFQLFVDQRFCLYWRF